MVNSVVLKNASIIDGSGSAPYSGHLVIKENKIDSIHQEDAFSQDTEPRSNDELFFHRREGLAAIIAGTNALKVLQSGVTSFFDADSLYSVGVDLRDAIESGVIVGPRMAVGGNALLTSAGGTAGRLIPDEGKRGYGAVVTSKDEIILEIRRQIKMGVDWIKIHVSGMVPRQSSEGELKAWSLDELKLACDTAHELGIPVVGHCRGADSVKDALLAGFDMILHGTYMDEEGLEIMIERNVPLVPTFTFQANLIDYAEKMEASTDYKEIFEKEIQDNVPIFTKAFEAGVPFICGSESGFSVTPYGDWHYKELEVFVEKLGLTPLEAITCATKNAASAMKRDDIGLIAEGKIADLLVVDGDPSKDVTILGDKNLIKHVFLNGKDIDLTPAPKRFKDPDGWRISAYSNKILEK